MRETQTFLDRRPEIDGMGEQGEQNRKASGGVVRRSKEVLWFVVTGYNKQGIRESSLDDGELYYMPQTAIGLRALRCDGRVGRI
jgi:hypothetical protein